MTDCIFCRIVAGEISADRVYEDELVLGFRDLNPQAPTHILLIPEEHITTINDVRAEDEAVVGRFVQCSVSGGCAGRYQ